MADAFSKSGLAQVKAPGIITSDKMRPTIPYGVASGDITTGSAMIWSRCDRAAKMIVEYDTSESFRNPKRILGPAALETSDYTARINLANLPPSQQIYYRIDNTFGPQVKFQSIPPNLKQNRPPTEGFQFFGTVKIDGDSEVMTVVLHNLEGKTLYSVELPPEV